MASFYITTTTRIHFVFRFVLKFGNPSEATIVLICTRKQKNQSILLEVMKWRHSANGLLDGHRSPWVYAAFPSVQGITRTQAQTEARGNEKFGLCLLLCLCLRSGRFNVEICTLTTTIYLIIQQPVINLSRQHGQEEASASIFFFFFYISISWMYLFPWIDLCFAKGWLLIVFSIQI